MRGSRRSGSKARALSHSLALLLRLRPRNPAPAASVEVARTKAVRREVRRVQPGDRAPKHVAANAKLTAGNALASRIPTAADGQLGKPTKQGGENGCARTE